jgi:hypothetical protein
MMGREWLGDDAAGEQQHGVGAQAHAGDVEFQQQVAGAVEQQGFEEVDGGGPGVALLGVGGKVGKEAEYQARGRREVGASMGEPG